MPEADRTWAADNPQALARLATRYDVRQPGVTGRVFSRVPGGAPGCGGMIAGSLLGSMAGTVLGTMIAQNFLGSHGLGHGDTGPGLAADSGNDARITRTTPGRTPTTSPVDSTIWDLASTATRLTYNGVSPSVN